jgi:hypothetical protein
VAAGNTLYLPVEVAGALLSMGDTHTAQGDSELDGTGVETSVNGKFKLTLHKKDSLPKFVSGLTHPLIETPDHYVVQVTALGELGPVMRRLQQHAATRSRVGSEFGLSRCRHRASLALRAAALPPEPLLPSARWPSLQGYTYADWLNELEDPQNAVFATSSIDRAMVVTYNQTRDWMMDTFDLSEDEAITAITIAVDFGVTQVGRRAVTRGSTGPAPACPSRRPASCSPLLVTGWSPPPPRPLPRPPNVIWQVVDGNFGMHALVPKSVFKA